MKIGIVGLGKMGLGFTKRLKDAGFVVYGYDPDVKAQNAFAAHGGIITTLEELPDHTEIIIILVPAGRPVDDVITTVQKNARAAHIIIDAGNSNFKESITHHKRLKEHAVQFLDCGTSGGILGQETGYSLTIGGDKATFELCRPIFEALAHEHGYLHVGPAGSGHYVKMVHNAIEYGLLEAYAEGFNLLKNGEYTDLDLAPIAHVWNHGTIIASQLLALSEYALTQNLEKNSGIIHETGTARWAIEHAQQHSIPVPVIKDALQVRLDSQQGNVNFATRYIALMRHIFGGHSV